ncbi:DUF3179 domain-containing protein [bacterium SCSIO 12741]|nr:DUF3179 domain-containing protein [bacterium SCSIO 12741]
MLRPLFYSLIFVLWSSVSFGQIRDPREVNQSWNTDTLEAEVPLDEFLCLLPRDGIPPIDDPYFVDGAKALVLGIPQEPVIVVERDGEAKAYPLSILMFHEIVNDRIGGLGITVTFCPLCHASIVFDRNLDVNGQPLELDFGVSGMLRHSDLVMWDRQTESWWQQMTGRAIVGELSGQELTILPSEITSLEDFVQFYPQGRVLQSKADNSYGSNPYHHYDSLGKKPFLFHGEVDDRLPPTEYVVNLYGQRIPKVYLLSVIQNQHLIQDQHEGQGILLLHESGQLSVMDEKEIRESKDLGKIAVFDPGEDTFLWKEGAIHDERSQSIWNHRGQCISGDRKGEQLNRLAYGVHFAFAWLNFYPNSQIYGQ